MPIYLIIHGHLQSGEIVKQRLSHHLGSDAIIISPNGPIMFDYDRYDWFPTQDNIYDCDPSHLIQYYQNLNIPDKYDGIIAIEQGCLVASILLNKRIITTKRLIIINPSPIPKIWKYIVPTGIKCRLCLINGINMLFMPSLGNNNIEITESRCEIDCRENYYNFLKP